VIHSFATETYDETEQLRSGVIGNQNIEDSGPLTQELMKPFDEELVVPLAREFMRAANEAGKPFFVWLNTSRIHLHTRLNDERCYAAEDFTSEADFHGSWMLQHDHDIRRCWADHRSTCPISSRISSTKGCSSPLRDTEKERAATCRGSFFSNLHFVRRYRRMPSRSISCL
jgi:hypothetical protein